MIYNRFNREISCHHVTTSPSHRITTSLHHCITMSPHHHVTMLVSHLPCPLPPNQSVICLAPCHQTSQSFDLPSTTASLCHHITVSPHHCITASLCHYATAPPHHHVTALPHHHVTVLVSHLPCLCHQTSQSFALPPVTKPVSHLTCPLLLHHHITASPC